MTQPQLVGATPDSSAIATRVMLALTGRRWTWPPKRVVEEYWCPETVGSINLVGRPVSAVNSVVGRDGRVFDYQLTDSFRMRVPALDYRGDWPYPWPGYDANGGVYPNAWRRFGVYLIVDYIYGSRPPIDVQRAIDELAIQLDWANCGDDRCQLPERVTSINREGVTWTVLDPQQFLEGGKLGLYYPDLIISIYGNKVRARAKVYSVEHAPPRRFSSQTMPVPE